jgi:hypothetical protein
MECSDFYRFDQERFKLQDATKTQVEIMWSSKIASKLRCAACFGNTEEKILLLQIVHLHHHKSCFMAIKKPVSKMVHT